MFGIQECVNKTETQLKAVESYMDSHGYFDPYEINIFEGLKRSVQREIMETFRTISLADLLKKCNVKETLDSTGLATGTLGAMGAQYLVPSYVSTRLYQAMSATDIAPAVCADVVQNQAGETVYINALVNALAGRSGFGGNADAGRFNNAQFKLERYTSPVRITNEMIEDNSYALMQGAIDGAGKAMARQSNNKLVAVLIRTTGTTGWGTKLTANAGAATTTPTNVGAIAKAVASAGAEAGIGFYHPNLLLCNSEAWGDAISITAGHPDIAPPRSPQYNAWYGGAMDVVIHNGTGMGTVATAGFTASKTIVLEKELAVVVARNNWLRIENYSNPVKDLAGAVVSGRMGAGELVDSAIGVLTET